MAKTRFEIKTFDSDINWYHYITIDDQHLNSLLKSNFFAIIWKHSKHGYVFGTFESSWTQTFILCQYVKKYFDSAKDIESKILHSKTINSKTSTFSIKVSTWRLVFNDIDTICIIYINKAYRMCVIKLSCHFNISKTK